MTSRSPRLPGMTAGRVVAATAAAAVVGLLLWYFGVDAAFAVALGVLTLAIGLVWTAYTGPSAVRWPVERPVPLAGSRSDVARLAWGFQMRHGSVREQGFKAVRELAELRLARAGFELYSDADRDAIVAAVGEAAYAALNPTRGILPSAAALQSTLDALDRLDAAIGIGAPTPQSGLARS